jgi:H+-transporting ATPase
VLATLIAVFGWFMPAIGWGWAGAVWGYALAWFFVNDCVKLAAYRIFDPASAALPAMKRLGGVAVDR